MIFCRGEGSGLSGAGDTHGARVEGANLKSQIVDRPVAALPKRKMRRAVDQGQRYSSGRRKREEDGDCGGRWAQGSAVTSYWLQVSLSVQPSQPSTSGRLSGG